jgi:hypothetical protein
MLSDSEKSRATNTLIDLEVPSHSAAFEDPPVIHALSLKEQGSHRPLREVERVRDMCLNVSLYLTFVLNVNLYLDLHKPDREHCTQ